MTNIIKKIEKIIRKIHDADAEGHCEKYKTEGCIFVNTPFCNFPNCDIKDIKLNIMEIDALAKEIIWYSEKDEKGRYRIPIVLDFDYTCTKASSWIDGTFEENPKCFETLRKWQKDYNCVYILDTMRGEENIGPALKFLDDNGIVLYGIGKNPEQHSELNSTNKAWGIYSIDDRNVGSFLVREKGKRPYINWDLTEMFLTPYLKKICERIPEIEDDVKLEKSKVYEEARAK